MPLWPPITLPVQPVIVYKGRKAAPFDALYLVRATTRSPSLTLSYRSIPKPFSFERPR
jgi:hypothetical protein